MPRRSTELASPMETPLVDALFDEVRRARLDELRFLETLTGDRPRAVQARIDAELRRARDELVPLEPWPTLGYRREVYENDQNVVRVRRLLDYLDEGDRIVDIGYGTGYLTGVILRDVRPSYYCGVDLHEKYVGSVREMADANRLDLTNVHLECRDLFDIDDAFMAHHRPDVVVMLEVLEHVPDAGAAMTHLGRVLAGDALLVVTVPMLGRFEDVWDHHSVFDVDRIEQVWSAAGLSLQYAESVHNTWALVAATRSPQPHPRLARIVATAPGVAGAPARNGSAVFDKVVVSSPHDVESRYTRRVRAQTTMPSRSCIRTVFRASPVSKGAGAIRLAAPDATLARFDLEIEPWSAVDRVEVVATGTDDGAVVAQWRLSRRRGVTAARSTMTIRRDRDTATSRRTFASEATIAELHLVVRLRRGARATVTLHRAAYVTAG